MLHQTFWSDTERKRVTFFRAGSGKLNSLFYFDKINDKQVVAMHVLKEIDASPDCLSQQTTDRKDSLYQCNIDLPIMIKDLIIN